MDKRKDLTKTPAFHITASYGWMNDPCGPGYDPATDTYHLFYQWNPKGCEWGNMSWGHVTSKDLVYWHRTGEQPSLEPDKPYDKEGVFTGCLHPTGLKGEPKELTLFYSSICKLPFSWETPPYPRGSAGIAVATSTDGGKSWTKIANNPIISEEPAGLQVTGYRDPFVSKWPSLDTILGKDSSLYAMVAGGVQNHGPAIFFYEIDPQDLSKWVYRGKLFETSIGYRPSRAWNADAGVNWECASFATLESGEASREFIMFGTEGGSDRDHIVNANTIQSKSLPQRTLRWCMWVCGSLSKRSNGEPHFDYKFGGFLDHGCFYAASTFNDPKHNRQIVWGWIVEEDVTIQRCRLKGWTGCLAMPREVYLLEYHNVVGSLRTELKDLASFEVESDPAKSCTLRTLGIRPLPEMTNLRCGKHQKAVSPLILTGTKKSAKLFQSTVPRWEVQTSIRVEKCAQVGLQIKHGKAGDCQTEIFFSPLEEQIVVRRPTQQHCPRGTSSVGKKGSGDPTAVNNREERGSHTLLKFENSDGHGKRVEDNEMLDLHVYRDGQVLEVFANNRFALATMIYIDNENDVTNDQIFWYAKSEGSADEVQHVHAVVEQAQMWEISDRIIDQEIPTRNGSMKSVHSSL